MAGVAYWILSATIIREEGKDSLLAKAVGKDIKGKMSVVFYAAAIALAFVDERIAQAIYVLVALTWLVPDRRIEKVMDSKA
jgi:uncharacterized membrane protein